MKTPFLVLLSVLLLQAEVDGKRCFNRGELKTMMRISAEMMCRRPMQQLIPVPIPDGYTRVTPSMVMAKKCTGLMCAGMNVGCMGIATTPKKVKVQLMDASNMMMCSTVTIYEDTDCACGCKLQPADCGRNKEVDPMSCQCVCRAQDQKNCMGAWKSDTCTCIGD